MTKEKVMECNEFLKDKKERVIDEKMMGLPQSIKEFEFEVSFATCKIYDEMFETFGVEKEEFEANVRIHFKKDGYVKIPFERKKGR